MNREYKNILFDLGNVLVEIDYDKTFEKLAELLTHADDSELHRLGRMYETGQMSTPLFLNAMLRMGTSQVQALDVIRAWNAMLIDIPQSSIDLLRKLDSSYNLYILSNTNKLHIEWVDRFLKKTYDIDNFDSLVSKAFYSYLIHLRKPNVEIYQKVIEKVGFEPEETLFIDDNEENIIGAQKCKFQTLHLTTPADVASYFNKRN